MWRKNCIFSGHNAVLFTKFALVYSSWFIAVHRNVRMGQMEIKVSAVPSTDTRKGWGETNQDWLLSSIL